MHLLYQIDVKKILNIANLLGTHLNAPSFRPVTSRLAPLIPGLFYYWSRKCTECTVSKGVIKHRVTTCSVFYFMKIRVQYSHPICLPEVHAMTRYTPPQSKHLPDPAEESVDSRRWRYLMILSSAVLLMAVIISWFSTPSGKDFGWKVYGLFALLSSFNVFFWGKWRWCLERDDDAPSAASQLAVVVVAFCGIYALIKTIILLA